MMNEEINIVEEISKQLFNKKYIKYEKQAKIIIDSLAELMTMKQFSPKLDYQISIKNIKYIDNDTAKIDFEILASDDYSHSFNSAKKTNLALIVKVDKLLKEISTVNEVESVLNYYLLNHHKNHYIFLSTKLITQEQMKRLREYSQKAILFYIKKIVNSYILPISDDLAEIGSLVYYLQIGDYNFKYTGPSELGKIKVIFSCSVAVSDDKGNFVADYRDSSFEVPFIDFDEYKKLVSWYSDFKKQSDEFQIDKNQEQSKNNINLSFTEEDWNKMFYKIAKEIQDENKELLIDNNYMFNVRLLMTSELGAQAQFIKGDKKDNILRLKQAIEFEIIHHILKGKIKEYDEGIGIRSKYFDGELVCGEKGIIYYDKNRNSHIIYYPKQSFMPNVNSVLKAKIEFDKTALPTGFGKIIRNAQNSKGQNISNEINKELNIIFDCYDKRINVNSKRYEDNKTFYYFNK